MGKKRTYNIVNDFFGSEEKRKQWEVELNRLDINNYTDKYINNYIDKFWHKRYKENIERYDLVVGKLKELALKNNSSVEDECKRLVELVYEKRNVDLTNDKVGYIAEKDFKVVKEIYFNEKTIKELADEFGVSSTRIGQLLNRGTYRLMLGCVKYVKSL